MIGFWYIFYFLLVHKGVTGDFCELIGEVPEDLWASNIKNHWMFGCACSIAGVVIKKRW